MGPRYLIDAFTGLLRLGWSTRFRLGSAYWKWRVETAFGPEPSPHPPLYKRMRMVLDYAAWTSRMRRLR